MVDERKNSLNFLNAREIFRGVRSILLLMAVGLLALEGAWAGGFVVQRDLVYGKGYVRPGGIEDAPALKDLLFDLYKPKEEGTESLPAVVMLHGGSFRAGSKENGKLTRIARFVAAEGYACFVLNYRLLGDSPPAPYPWDALVWQSAVHAAFVDAKTAIRHVRTNAATYGVDPKRVAVLGESAGAFAALAAGVSDRGDFASDGPGLAVPPENNPEADGKPNAVVDLWGSAELVKDKFSPDDPPILVIHGTKDDHIGVFFPVALNIKKACEEQGIPLRFYAMEGAGHGAAETKIDGKSIPEVVVGFLREFLR